MLVGCLVHVWERSVMCLSLTAIHFVYICLPVIQPQPQSILDHPITVQAVGTNGRQFEFVVFQLNTTDLCDDQGIKNQVWYYIRCCIF